MERADVDGLSIAYELLGPEGAPAIALTPGGRFSMDSPGVREMGQAMADAGRRVLLWDRPNCGASDMCFDHPSESVLQAEALNGLIRELGLGPCVIAGGSGGSRVSMIAASRAPELCTHLIVWWVSGGPISLAQLAAYYCGSPAQAAVLGGMEAVVNAPDFTEQLSKNPANRDYILKYDQKDFIARMQEWALAYAPSDVSPVPDMEPEHFAALKMPVLVIQNGASDLSHTRATTEWVHQMIPHSEIASPPWDDGEWNYRMMKNFEDQSGLFNSWEKLAPKILDFTA